METTIEKSELEWTIPAVGTTVRGCAWLCDGVNAAAWRGEVEGWGGGAEILCKKRGDAAPATRDEKN
jgi:hypothetical protein